MAVLCSEDLLKLLLALVCGSIIGIEREYSSKAAGFRTITLISIGSTLFTLVSVKLGGLQNGDRIAANIITGIGFIGAGVVFKDAFTISGLTTASTIWIAAALGMEIGSGEYVTAGEGLALTMVVLLLFEYLQRIIDNLHQKRSYKINFKKDLSKQTEIEKTLSEIRLKFFLLRELKQDDELIYLYDVSGSRKKLDKFNAFLIDCKEVKSFEC